MKRFLSSLLLFCSLVGVGGACTAVSSDTSYTLKVTCLNVGAADCTVVETPNYVVVIDTGEDTKATILLAYLKEAGITSLDYLIITHPDADHIGGAAALLKAYPAARILQTGYQKDSKEEKAYEDALQAVGVKAETVKETLTETLDDLILTVYPPLKKKYQEKTSNNSSLVITLEQGENRFLLAGDAEAERLTELYNQLPDLHFQYLKVPHHGRENTESEAFLTAVSPEYAIITSSVHEPEDTAVIAALTKQNANILLTRRGTVTAYSNAAEPLVVRQGTE